MVRIYLDGEGMFDSTRSYSLWFDLRGCGKIQNCGI